MYLPGQRLRHRHYCFQRTFRDDFTAVNTRTRTDIDHMISGANRVFVVLHHNHGITEIAQMDKRTQQALVIALVQADRRLIQHVHHAKRACTNLARQTNTLGFTAGKCLC